MNKILGFTDQANYYVREIMQSIIYMKFPDIRKNQVKMKVYAEGDSITAVPFGKQTPLSKCCKMTLCFQAVNGLGGKVVCMEQLCPFNPIGRFSLSVEEMRDLFGSMH